MLAMRCQQLRTLYRYTNTVFKLYTYHCRDFPVYHWRDFPDNSYREPNVHSLNTFEASLWWVINSRYFALLLVYISILSRLPCRTPLTIATHGNRSIIKGTLPANLCSFRLYHDSRWWNFPENSRSVETTDIKSCQEVWPSASLERFASYTYFVLGLQRACFDVMFLESIEKCIALLCN